MMPSRFAVSLALVCASACVTPDGQEDEVGDATDTGTTDTSTTDTSTTDTSTTDTSTTDASTTDTSTTDTSTDTSTDTGPPPDSCEGIGSSTLPGVCIWFPSPGESFSLAEAAAGVTIPYHVIVEADVDDVMPQPQDDGGCGQPDASGLIVFAILQGGGQQYCLCDVGICPAPGDVVTIPAGDSAFEFEWTGVNWGGPSDTNNPLGPAFPAGEYTLEISAIGKVGGVDFSVSNTFAVSLVE